MDENLNPAYVKLAKALKEFFSGSPYEEELLLLLMTSLILFFVWVLVTKFLTTHRKNQVTKKDLEFFNQVVLQKGLEDDERVLLLTATEIYGITPIYKILIDQDYFSAVEKKIEEDLKKDAPYKSILHQNADQFHKIRAKLFAQN